MKLMQVPLTSRAFLIQLHEIFGEFGHVIPWLSSLWNLQFVTNRKYFTEGFAARLGFQEHKDIHIYQFVMSTRSREYFGGILHFPSDPEEFSDEYNQILQTQLRASGHHYITCLQIRTGFRGYGIGNTMLFRALALILEQHPKIWGVVSERRLLSGSIDKQKTN